jgi:hypothetical protein
VTIGRQSILSIVIVGLTVLCGLIATAALAQVQLLAGAASSSAVTVVLFLLFLGLPLIIASGLPTALVLRRSGVKIVVAYAANAIVSAALAAYASLYNFGVADNLGAILRHLPRNGRDSSDGIIYAAPPFFDTLADAFGNIGGFIGEERNLLAAAAVVALLVSLPCGWLFWRHFVRDALSAPK